MLGLACTLSWRTVNVLFARVRHKTNHIKQFTLSPSLHCELLPILVYVIEQTSLGWMAVPRSPPTPGIPHIVYTSQPSQLGIYKTRRPRRRARRPETCIIVVALSIMVKIFLFSRTTLDKNMYKEDLNTTVNIRLKTQDEKGRERVSEQVLQSKPRLSNSF